MKMKAPDPINDGSEIQCPIVDVARIEAMAAGEVAKLSGFDMLCRWRGDGSPESLAEYDRHFREDHWEPFVAGGEL